MTDTGKIILTISGFFESFWNILSYPGRLIREDLDSGLFNLTQRYGLDLIYVSTVFVNLVALTYWRNLRNWKTQSDHVKHLAIITLIAAGFLNLLSLLKILGVIDF